jgi:hypothetical protein
VVEKFDPVEICRELVVVGLCDCGANPSRQQSDVEMNQVLFLKELVRGLSKA